MKKLLLILMGLGLFLLSACEINVNVDGIKNYTIRFLNYDYSLLQELKVREGDTPAYSKDTPVREDDENYTYTFSGWDKEIKPATSDEVYKAQFTQTKKGSPIEVEKVLAIFMNGDTKLAEVEVEKGGTPVYSGSAPTKASDEEFDYTFEGWAPELSPITEDTTYQAQFIAHAKEPEVEYVMATFMNGNTKLAEVEIEKGETPVYNGSLPIKASDENYTYTFSGWSPELSPITEDTTYQAQFIAHEKAPEVEYVMATFMNGNTKLAEVEIKKGETPLYNGPTPTKASDENYTYTFSGWSPELAPITEDTTYQAQFEAHEIYVMATFMNGNTKLAEVEIKKGETPVYNGSTPIKASDENYTYSFSGWSPELGPITEDTTYQAQFEAHEIYVKATFMNGNTKLAEVEIKKGETPVYNGSTPTKASDEDYTYTFSGWSPELGPITEDTTYQAQFIAHEKETDEFDVETPWIEG